MRIGENGFPAWLNTLAALNRRRARPLRCGSKTDPLNIQVLGQLRISVSGQELTIPPSRKTRALLGYLLLSGAPQRRERLCELLWDVPDDPRGALRWSMSKIRTLLNADGGDRLVADRERVSVDATAVTVDIHRVSRLLEDGRAPADALADAWHACRQTLLEDCDLPNLHDFSAWLARERAQLVRLRTRLAQRLADMCAAIPAHAIQWADAWLEDAPLDPGAAARVVDARLKAGCIDDAILLRGSLQERFEEAGRRSPDWPDEPPPEHGGVAEPVPPDDELERAFRSAQRVRFVHGHDGACLAWATAGREDGPPLVKAANWLSHLELDWQAPIWSPLLRDLALRHNLLRYDERGCGLSDWDVPDISFDTFVTDLETVVDAAGVERFALLGISQGAAVSIEYAARHPDRVSKLVLFGGYAAGWRCMASPQEVREREAVMVLTEAGWGRDDPAYRHLFTQSFMPGATAEELSWFNEFQRRTTSPGNAVRFLEAFSRIDVRHRLSGLRVPTLVIHSRGDRRIPLATGRALAAAIPGAQFASVDSPNHLLLGREPAAEQFLSVVRDFLRD